MKLLFGGDFSQVFQKVKQRRHLKKRIRLISAGTFKNRTIQSFKRDLQSQRTEENCLKIPTLKKTHDIRADRIERK